MLRQVIFKNILSFGEQVSFDFSKNHKTMILGPNASGKSNVIRGAELLTYLIANDWNLHIPMFEQLNNFKPNTNCDSDFSEIQCEIEVEKNIYTIYFKIELAKNIKITSEELYLNNKKILSCNRYDDNVDITGEFSEIELERIMTYSLSDISLISLINENDIVIKDEILKNALKKIYEFFQHNIIFAEMHIGESRAATILAENHEIKKKVLSFLKSCNIQIDDITFNDKSFEYIEAYSKGLNDDLELGKIEKGEHTRIIKNLEKIKIYNFDKIKKNNKELYYSTESKGTKNLITLLTTLYAKEGAVIFFDELESSFHELLCIKILKFINEQKINQIIFTSHLIEIMDNRWFDKNEIFLLYNENEMTNVIQLDEYKELRSDEKHSWKNWYRTRKISGYPDFEV